MKPEINRVKRALAGENATSPTSRMVKVQGGRLFAYGGTFCLSVPCALDLDVGFLPEPVLNFYEIPREGEVITVSDGHLKITAGGRSVRIPCLPAGDLPIIDVLRPPSGTTLDIDNLRRALTFVDVMDDYHQFHGVSFVAGCLHAGKIGRVFTGASGLTEDLQPFRLPVASVEGILKVDSPITTFYMDQDAVRLDFEDGTRLVSRRLEDEWPKSSNGIFAANGAEFSVKEEALKEILKTKCHSWRLGTDGSASHFGEGSEGVVEEVTTGVEGEFCIHHTSLELMLGLGTSLEVTDRAVLIRGENFAAAVALMRN